MDISARQEELHAAITASAMLERRIFELQQQGAPIDDIAAVIEQRVQFEKTAQRLNVEIATETQSRNLSHFLDQIQMIVHDELLAAGFGKTLTEVAARQKKFERESRDDRSALRERIDALSDQFNSLALQFNAYIAPLPIEARNARVAQIDDHEARLKALEGGE
jgi:hypothetical protein